MGAIASHGNFLVKSAFFTCPACVDSSLSGSKRAGQSSTSVASTHSSASPHQAQRQPCGALRAAASSSGMASVDSAMPVPTPP